jgi:SAM-dependent methyltransferase
MTKKKYLKIVEHYEKCLRIHGDNHLGVDWPNEEEALLRYKIMLEIIPPKKNYSLLDFGCGTANLFWYMNTYGYQNIDYTGLDLSSDFVNFCKQKYPLINFLCVDIMETPDLIDKFDFIILNGVFTEKLELTFEEMFVYFKNQIRILFEKSNYGIAFNVMSKHVDWERNDLFHLPFDLLASFLKQEVSRNFIIRNDYGLYEYTVYIFKKPNIWQK